MIYIKQEPFHSCIEEMSAKLVDQWKETEMYQDKMPLDPDWDMYGTMEQADLLRTYVVRDAGTLVGYAIYFLSTMPHHKGVRVADSDIVYLDPYYRGGTVATELYNYAETSLRAEGVDVIILRTKTKVPLDTLAERLGYHEEEKSFAKWIGA